MLKNFKMIVNTNYALILHFNKKNVMLKLTF